MSRLHLKPFLLHAFVLNPDEVVWNYLKNFLTNSRQNTLAELLELLKYEICRLSSSQPLLHGYIQQSELSPFITLSASLLMGLAIVSLRTFPM